MSSMSHLPVLGIETALTSRQSPALFRFGRRITLVLTLLISCFGAAPGSIAQARGQAWETASAGSLTVLMQPNDRLAASSFLDAYGTFAEVAVEEVSLLLDLPGASRTIVLQVYAEGHIYDAAIGGTSRNEVDRVMAVADPARSTIHIPLSRFIGLTPFDANNELRHAIAHVMVGQASNLMIPRGFDEGFAHYVERVNPPELARLASVVQSAHQQGSLASWSNMNRQEPLDDDELVEAQAYAVVGFLLKNHGLARFQNFVAELEATTTWRDAMNVAYAPGSSDSLERQWRDEIPLWAQGDWKWNLVAGFDLQPARDLLSRGNFNGAASALLVSEQLLSEIDDPDRHAEVIELKDQARIGGLAEAKMTEAQTALENFAYERAFAAVEQADEQYSHLPEDLRPVDLIEIYRDMAETGLRSTEQLDVARIQSGAWADYPHARDAALNAGAGFATLGDAENHENADTLIDQMDNAQLRLVLLLGALAFLTVAWLGLWLWYREPSQLKWDGQE